jgi:alpha-beta hydrolase superfamily lysophospholipase
VKTKRLSGRSAAIAVAILAVASGAFADAAPRAVQFTTPDGFAIHGTLYPGRYAKGVICLPMMKHARATYAAFAAKLQDAGLWVLAIDLRGHGESVTQSGKRRAVDDFGPADFLGMEQDLVAAIKFLGKEAKLGPGQIAVVGASIGANLALRQAAATPGVRAIVLLSPGFNYRGLATLEAPKRLAGVSVFYAASADDAYSADAVRELAKGTSVPKEVAVLDDAGHGTEMFEKAPGFLDRVVKWLLETM